MKILPLKNDDFGATRWLRGQLNSTEWSALVSVANRECSCNHIAAFD